MRVVDLYPIRLALRYGATRTVECAGVVHRLAHFGMVPATLCQEQSFGLTPVALEAAGRDVTCVGCQRAESLGAVPVLLGGDKPKWPNKPRRKLGSGNFQVVGMS